MKLLVGLFLVFSTPWLQATVYMMPHNMSIGDIQEHLSFKDFDINIQGVTGNTALHFSVLHDFFDNTKLIFLLKKKADTSIRNDKGQTPLHLAVLKRDIKKVKILIKYGANINDKYYPVLHLAVGDINMTKLLIKKGADIYAKRFIYGTTILHSSVLFHNISYFMWFIDNVKGSNELLLIKDDDGNTPLHEIASSIYLGDPHSFEKVIKKMKKMKAVNIVNNDGETPTDVARYDYRVKLLKKYGGYFNRYHWLQ